MDFFKERFKKFEIEKKEVVAPFPRNALVEVSNACNHACIFCYNTLMGREVGKLNKVTFREFLNDAVKTGLVEVGLYTTGEPFCVRDLHEYIEIAKNEGIRRVYVTTNGALADKEYVEKCVKHGLDSIKFSINAIDRETYHAVHGKDDWETVVKNLQDAYALKKSYPHLQLLGSCIMSKLTGDIRAEHRDFFSEYLEDILYAFAKPQCGRNSQYLDKVSFPAVKVPVSEVEPCGMLWNRWHLTYEGYLTCCCVDYELDLVYADIKLQKPAKAWNNELMQKMRQKHLTKQLEGIICYNCLTGEDSSYHPISDIGAEVRNRKDSSVHKLDRYLGRLSKIYDTTQLDPTANI